MIRTEQNIPIYSTTAIDANTIVQINEYEITKRAWKVSIPSSGLVAPNLLLVTSCELYSPSYAGFGQLGDGIYTIWWKGSGSLIVGDKLDALAAKNAKGMFTVLHYDSNSKRALCRPIGGVSDGGLGFYKVKSVVTGNATYGNYISVNQQIPSWDTNNQRITFNSSATNLVAFAIPEVPYNLYQKLINKTLTGKTINGFLFLGTEPWSIW